MWKGFCWVEYFLQIRSHLKRVKHTFYLRLTPDTSIRCIFVCWGLITQAAARPLVALSCVILWAWCIWTGRISGSESQRHPTLQTRVHTGWKPDKSKKLTTFSTHTHTRAPRLAPPTTRDHTNRRRVWVSKGLLLSVYLSSSDQTQIYCCGTNTKARRRRNPDPRDSAGEFFTWIQQQQKSTSHFLRFFPAQHLNFSVGSFIPELIFKMTFAFYD